MISKVKDSKQDLTYITLFLYFIFSYIAIFIPDFRYFKYFLPVIVLIFYTKVSYLVKNQETYYSLRKYLKSFLNIYIIISIFSLGNEVINSTISIRYFANILFILLPLFYVYLLIPFLNLKRIDSYFKFLVYGSLLGYCLEKGPQILKTLGNVKSILNGFIDSEVSSESNLYPFILSFLLVYCVYYKFSKSLSFFTFIGVILSYKRIVFLGLLLIVFFSILISKEKFKSIKNTTKPYSFIFAVFSSLIMAIYYFTAAGNFDTIILSLTGESTNAFLQGRQLLYQLAINDTRSNLFIGAGIGTIDNILKSHTNDINGITNLHSELFRMFLEIGGILYFIWSYFIFSKSLKTYYIFLSFILLYVLLLTDNVFIIFDTMFLFYLLSLFSIIKDKALIE